MPEFPIATPFATPVRNTPPTSYTAADMALITLSSVTHHFGGPTLLDRVTAEVKPGAKVGLIGQNGTGKTTILRLVTGEVEPEEGQVFRQRRLKISHQSQELNITPGATVMDELMRVFSAQAERAERLAALEQDLADELPPDQQARTLAAYERLQQEHLTAGGYSVEQRIESVLSGLGLPRESWDRPIEGFSGGERNVIGLARVLLEEPDVMLLDEPSNHLDMDGIEWFIDFIRRTPAAVVMVSHNRHLLDATAKEIWELRSRRITRYKGNYSDFQRQKAEALALQERQYKSQQRLIKRIEFQARRLMDMANAYDDPAQAKRAKSMLKRIEQMDKVEAPDRSEQRFRAGFKGGRHGRIALSVSGLDLGYVETDDAPERDILCAAGLELEFGDRVALVGPNGSGKTSLFRAILKHADWEYPDVDVTDGAMRIRGGLRLGKSVKVGDYSQLHDVLDHGKSLIDWTMEITGLRFQPASELLHKFLFSRDDLVREIGTLSGGEKSRLQLARLVHEGVNFLMLDEPTNHLDIQACEQLEEMLEDFDGTLLIISHDRYFLDKLIDRVVELKDRKLEVQDGSFAGWWAEKHKAAKENSKGGLLKLKSQENAAKDAPGSAKIEREQRKAEQREQHKARTRLRSLEQKIEKLESMKEEIGEKIAQAYRPGSDLDAAELGREHKRVSEELQQAYAEWEEAADAVHS